MTSAAIYARVSSARQKKDETIGSQTQALREHAAQARLDVPAEWVFEDEGHSGATLVRPALEALPHPAGLPAQHRVLMPEHQQPASFTRSPRHSKTTRPSIRHVST